ncbi:protein CNGC15b-like [Diospyros lotus]|uniref:protein CNGC15b-like n=1 Tax=Diospyros lotus TaxID=55363 RepID=UPI002251D426|nr:protein CNGC15b-like [Diospyros lotus]
MAADQKESSAHNEPAGKELTRVFSEDYEVVEKTILDPRGPVVNQWNKCLFVACLVSLFVDPLFLYLPVVGEDECIQINVAMEVTLTAIRSMVDLLYTIQIFVRFRTAYVSPSSRVIGRGELVIDPSKIASRYLHKDFWLDLLAAVPLPQLLAWAAVPYLRGTNLINLKIFLRLTVIIQFLLRLYLIFPLSSQIIKATGVVMERAWAGAAYNLMLFLLASHVLGASWHLLAIERQAGCWKEACGHNEESCEAWFFDCGRVDDSSRAAWFRSSNISHLCDPKADLFQFGIYAEAVILGVTKSRFLNKYLYCLWWGLRGLSSLGQNLYPSICVGEINFTLIIAILGLLFFALLIGNMQAYLQSTRMRLEEYRIKKTDTEQWMHHRQLPHELRERVRCYDQKRWVTTRGVDEEAILRGLPLDLRRDIKRHLCLSLVRRVPLFDQMEEHILDAICERLKPVLCTPGTCLVREGDPVGEMLFIIRGHLDSYTTGGGRTGFFNSSRLGPCDFCGEELLTWALDPRQGVLLPSSTRTVKALSDVEAFALISEDLKFVATKFRRLHSKQLKHTFRLHSHQWRTWAACFIQAAWFRYKRLRQAAALKSRECSQRPSAAEPPADIQTGTFARKSMRVGSRSCEFDLSTTLQKPLEPIFSFENR